MCFPNAYLKVIGFGRNANGDFGILVEQPYIEGDKVSENERMVFMYEMGFSDAGMDFDMHLNY